MLLSGLSPDLSQAAASRGSLPDPLRSCFGEAGSGWDAARNRWGPGNWCSGRTGPKQLVLSASRTSVV